MLEKIYTIPVNEAFDACRDNEAPECPFCRLYKKLENDELDIILGAAMMEPDVRIKTNEQGFCGKHYRNMLERKNRLGLALMLESHLDVVRKVTEPQLLSLMGVGVSASKKLGELEEDCYVCRRIDHSLGKMVENAALLWQTEPEFRDKLAAQKMVCLPHYRMFAETARNILSKKEFSRFYEELSKVVNTYFDSLRGDVSWFCKKFDYRYEDEPWGNSKDAAERAVRFLSGEM